MPEVRIYGDPLLRKKAAPVTIFDQKFAAFVEELIKTMKENDGVGLAAPQVGESSRVVVIDTTGGEEPARVLVNPQITFFSEEREDYDEGCLSVPDITLKVNRPSRVSVSALDEKGQAFTIENATGLLARAIQHEVDHLDGILFVDRASPVLRQLVAGKLKKLAKSQREAASVA
jgi:peptide deformylase